MRVHFASITCVVAFVCLVVGCESNPNGEDRPDSVLLVKDLDSLRQHLVEGTVQWDSVVEMPGGERRFVLDHIVRKGDVPLLEHAISIAGSDAVVHIESCHFIAEAAAACNQPIVEWLIVENGTDPNCFTGSGRVPLFVSLHCGVEFLAAIVELGVDLHIRHVTGCTPLYGASGCCEYDVVEYLIKHGEDIAEIDSDECLYGSPLHAAAEGCQTEVLELLLSVGADVNRRRPDTGETPLHTIMFCPQAFRVVEHLLRNGADVNLRSHENVSPLHWAVGRLRFAEDETLAIVHLLLEAGSDIDVRCDPYGRTPLLYAANQGSAAAMRILVEAGADVHATDLDGNGIRELAKRRYANPDSAQGRAGFEVNAYLESLALPDGIADK